MAHLGDLVRAKALVLSATRTFGPKEALARARAHDANFGCWGATEQLWNAFHNCSVAPQHPSTLTSSASCGRGVPEVGAHAYQGRTSRTGSRAATLAGIAPGGQPQSDSWFSSI